MQHYLCYETLCSVQCATNIDDSKLIKFHLRNKCLYFKLVLSVVLFDRGQVGLGQNYCKFSYQHNSIANAQLIAAFQIEKAVKTFSISTEWPFTSVNDS